MFSNIQEINMKKRGIEEIGRELEAIDKAVSMSGWLFRQHPEGTAKRHVEPLQEQARLLVMEMIEALKPSDE
jgi:hypothetical protein